MFWNKKNTLIFIVVSTIKLNLNGAFKAVRFILNFLKISVEGIRVGFVL